MTDHTRTAVLIVDGYSTGRELVRELNSRGIHCHHLRSTARPAAHTCFDPSPYASDLGYRGDVASASPDVAALGVQAVVPGSEWGVTFAERLAGRLGLPTNRVERLQARRDKFEMTEAVRRFGLHTAAQTRAITAQQAFDWIERHGRWPVVVKPLNSAGADGVSICLNRDHVACAFDRSLHQRNFMGLYNDCLLVQSYLAGPQFIVNSVSRAGRHYVTDMWRMTLHTLAGSAIVPEEIHLLDPDRPAAQVLATYATGVLDALGIENGAAHTELRWTDAGPALIECGARLMGAAMDSPSYQAAGLPSQASLYAHVLTASPREIDALFDQRHYHRGLHLTKVFFRFGRAGTVGGTEGLRRLRELRSFHAHYRALARGARVWKTADALACGGVVYLVHENAAQIETDLATLRRWESCGDLYTIIEDAATSAAAR